MKDSDTEINMQRLHLYQHSLKLAFVSLQLRRMSSIWCAAKKQSTVELLQTMPKYGHSCMLFLILIWPCVCNQEYFVWNRWAPVIYTHHTYCKYWQVKWITMIISSLWNVGSSCGSYLDMYHPLKYYCTPRTPLSPTTLTSKTGKCEERLTENDEESETLTCFQTPQIPIRWSTHGMWQNYGWSRVPIPKRPRKSYWPLVSGTTEHPQWSSVHVLTG